MTWWVRDGDAARERRVVRVRPLGFVPAEANLQRPVIGTGLVPRGELVDRLREHTDLPVVLVTAPPGYGKTTLLAQWDDEDERPFVWLTLDETCDDPAVLITYLQLALQRVGDADPGVVGALADRSDVPTVVAPRLGRLLSRQQIPFVLVLDDADRVTSPEALDVLTMIAKHLKDGTQLVLAARTPPDLPWSRLRAERGLLAIDQNDLKLTSTEADAELTAAELDLPSAEAAALLERAEGWPAGVSLGALSLRQAAAHNPAGGVLGSQDSVVLEYLRREVLGGLAPADRSFLVRSSVLQRMCGRLCDAVLERTGSDGVLSELERSNVFLVPLGGPERWYRYHHLLAAVLEQELAEEDPAQVRALHSRASRWLEAAGSVEEAVRHAQAAQEVDRAARLIWSQAGQYLGSGRGATLRGWLAGFSDEQLVGHPMLAVTAAWCAVESGRPVDYWITAAERATSDASRSGDVEELSAGLALLHAVRAAGRVQQLHRDADEAAARHASADPFRTVAQYLQAVAVLLGDGGPDDARDALEATSRLAEALALPSYQALCQAQLAAIAVEAGGWQEATEHAERASALLVGNDAADGPWFSVVHCVTTLVLARAGQADEARRLARRCLRTVATASDCPAWLLVQTRYLLGRANLVLGDTAAARVLLSEAQLQLRAVPDASWLRDRLDDAWHHVERFPLAMGIGPSALTSAEMRVLQLLPTHLSFEEIGKRLFLSRNTVKTQAIAAYRKLGVTSRSDAVGQARSLGML